MRRLLTPGWLAGHALMVAAVATMLGLAGWQLSRATSGNMLSWGYTIQWPVFAGFVVYLWWREVQRARRGERAEPTRLVVGKVRPLLTGRSGPAEAAYDDSDDPELAAYNRYLDWLSANPGARPVDYPG